MPKEKCKKSKKRKRGKIDSRLLKETKGSERRELDTFSGLSFNDTGNQKVCINSVLQDELLELILVYLPLASIIRARLVCKKWRDITACKRFLWIASQTVSQKPWYSTFICDSENERSGYAYDPNIRKWRRAEFLDMMKSRIVYDSSEMEMESCIVHDSSDGLVCYIKDYAIYVCNPITKEHKMLPEPRGFIRNLRLMKSVGWLVGPILTNISVNRRAHAYIVSLLTCEKDDGDDCGYLSVQMYDSVTMKWITSQKESLMGWTWTVRSDSKSVICNRVLYFLVHSTVDDDVDDDSEELGLLAYNLPSNSSSNGTLIRSVIPIPCDRVYGLMNLKENVIMVGGISSPSGDGLFLGFGIWLLEGKDWHAISRITGHSFEHRRGNIFKSFGADDLIYIRCNYDRLVVFDMNLKQWKWSQKLSLDDRCDGFCFQPRLDISPYSQPPRELPSFKETVSRKPWFFMFTSNSESEPNVYAYDPILQDWIGRGFMDMMESYMFCDSSDGLVCYIKDHTIHVCNPITREHKMLQEPPGFTRLIEHGYYPLTNISVDRREHNYIVTVLSSEGISYHGKLSVQIYDSTTMKWTSWWTEFPTGWKAGYKSVICKGVLFFLIESTSDDSKRPGLLAYKLSSNFSSPGQLVNCIIRLPCSNVCGLLNLKGNLIVVGGIEFKETIGFSIWHLEGNHWQVISRITDDRFEQYYGDSFESSGADDLIYIHGSDDPGLVVFDMNLKQWKLCPKLPDACGSVGFCFQPRLDISPYSQPQREITSSKMSLWNASQSVSQQPWFFAFFVGNSASEPNGYAYDPVLQKWQCRDLLGVMKSDIFCDASDGLVCYIKDSAIHVCNPVTREHNMLPDAPGLARLIEYCKYGYPILINISVNQRARNYNVSAVALACEKVTGYRQALSIQIYDSTTMKWATFQLEILPGWTIGCKSVICNRVLYILMGYTGGDSKKHCLVAYNFSSYSSSNSIIRTFVSLPCKLIYGLINLKENLIVVGGIEFGDAIIGFSVWLLEGNDWHVISRITDRCFQECCFENYDNLTIFGSSGADNLIYIHGKYDPGLVVFDMNLKRWKWCEKFPVAGEPSGFCFQPRLDISP